MSLHAGIKLRHIDATLDIEQGSPLVLVGPNGAGKTTILRAITGLERIESGTISSNGIVFDSHEEWVPPERRRIGYVPQQRFLFPHLSVLDNVAFATRNRSLANQWITRAGLQSFSDRKPTSLSGGEAARVALARALASNPSILLLDEPLAALDATSKSEMRSFLKEVLRTFEGVTIVVTHDPLEALSTASEIAVLEAGSITQRGAVREIVERPRTSYIARFLGLNLLRGFSEGVKVRCGSADVIIADEAPAKDVLLTFPATAVALTTSAPDGAVRNVYQCKVREIIDEGTRLRVALEGPLSLIAEVTRAGGESLNISPGSFVFASIKATEIQANPA
ncbi:MAG: sulfate/molybdate ABC transporter ATP-binding protein [Actinomycetota bacterium]